jgi:hypothetical protein
MGVNLKLDWNSEDVELWRSNKTEKALVAALKNAGNKTIKEQKKDSFSYIKERKAIRSEVIDKGLVLTNTGRKVKIEDLVWVEDVSGKPMSLAKFSYIRTPLGMNVKINEKGGFKLIRHSFMARLGSGHLGLFRRAGKARLPIRELYSSRLSDVMSDAGAVPKIHGQATVKFEKEFKKSMELPLAKRTPLFIAL